MLGPRWVHWVPVGSILGPFWVQFRPLRVHVGSWTRTSPEVLTQESAFRQGSDLHKNQRRVFLKKCRRAKRADPAGSAGSDPRLMKKRIGDTRISAFGDTRKSAFGLWEPTALTHVLAHLVLDTSTSEVHGEIPPARPMVGLHLQHRCGTASVSSVSSAWEYPSCLQWRSGRFHFHAHLGALPQPRNHLSRVHACDTPPSPLEPLHSPGPCPSLVFNKKVCVDSTSSQPKRQPRPARSSMGMFLPLILFDS